MSSPLTEAKDPIPFLLSVMWRRQPIRISLHFETVIARTRLFNGDQSRGTRDCVSMTKSKIWVFPYSARLIHNVYHDMHYLNLRLIRRRLRVPFTFLEPGPIVLPLPSIRSWGQGGSLGMRSNASKCLSSHQIAIGTVRSPCSRFLVAEQSSLQNSH